MVYPQQSRDQNVSDVIVTTEVLNKPSRLDHCHRLTDINDVVSNASFIENSFNVINYTLQFRPQWRPSLGITVNKQIINENYQTKIANV